MQDVNRLIPIHRNLWCNWFWGTGAIIRAFQCSIAKKKVHHAACVIETHRHIVGAITLSVFVSIFLIITMKQ